MKKKTFTVVLILLILLTATGLTYSGWGPYTDDFGPIVVQGHPWGEEPHSTNDPPSYSPGSGGGSPTQSNIPVFTNFAVKFYLKYVVKGMKNGQSSIRNNRKGD